MEKKDKKKKKEKCPRIKARLNKTRSEGWVGGGLRLLERKVNPFGGGVGCPHISKHLAIGLGRKTVPRKQI